MAAKSSAVRSLEVAWRRNAVLASSGVSNPQEGHTAVPDLYGDLGSTGIYGIFQQFLDNAGRAFHHLTGGDQIGDMLRKLNDLGHSFTSTPEYLRH